MRIKQERTSVYHVITRVVAGEMLLDGPAKEILRKMLWQVAGFCGVELISYVIMTNHLHILVRVPEVPEGGVPRDELARRYRCLYGEGRAGFFPEPDVMDVLLNEDSEEGERWAARLRARMNDVSAFMKTLKQRFSWWYNKSHKRFGTLWAERFKSVLVEDDAHSLQVVAAYIDLNPVRAGLVEDPGDYRWSSYGEATGGEELAQRGLASAVGQRDWGEAAAHYRMVLFGKGGQGRVGEQGAIPHDRVVEVLGNGGKIPLSALLRHRIRFLTQGAILGSEEFVRAAAAEAACPSRAARGKKKLGRLPTKEALPLRSWRRPS